MTRPTRPKGAPVLWRLGEGAAPAGPHVALVPGAQVPLLPLALPEKLRGMARDRVAERQLMDQLSLPDGGFEMRPLTVKGTGQWSRALVADAALAKGWRAALRPGCSALLPDYLALPAAAGLWAIDVDGGLVRARLGQDDGFSAEPELAQAMLADLPAPKAILRSGQAEAGLDAYLATLGVPVHDTVSGLKKSGISLLRWSEATGGVNLKDPPSAGLDRLRDRILRWRVPVVFGVLALAAWTATILLETRQHRADALRDRQLTSDLVRQHFVPTGPILDVRAQVSAAMDRAAQPVQAEAGTIPALGQFQVAAEVLTAADIRVLAASYRSDTGLVTAVEASDFTVLDQVIEALQAAGFLVEQQESRAQQTGGVVARLALELTQ
ncbi:MAG: type II secretion system protein GspL [Rhodobacter sp.]|nr:type II secretion system protein GspL [Rhodobacter sp.]